MNDITAELGLIKRQMRDVQAVASNIDHRTRKLIEPATVDRPGGLAARLAACHLIAKSERRQPADVAKQHFAADRDLSHLIELKAAVAPAMTGVAGWAAELAAVTVVDIATNLLPASALAQLRAASGLMPSSTARWRGCRSIRRHRQAHLSPRAAQSRLAH